ncbi:MAG: T9SS type A sorting domain-containing protein [Candidatus Azobacteroides sp.]|nr:T9SS type A sorting domain-containing protein [Candidatus Azobacteroides sp.]
MRNILSTIIYVCATTICFAQETSLIKWTFDRPFENSSLSESSISANAGIAAVNSGLWSNVVVSAGGAENGEGYSSVDGWDFSDTPTAYYLFPDITIPEKYDEIIIKLFLFSGQNGLSGPKAYNLEARIDDETSWNLINVFTLTEAEQWTQFVATTTAIKDATKVSFRIRANSAQSLDGGTISLFSSSGADNFEVIGANRTLNGLAKITSNGEKIYVNDHGQLIIESESPLQNITIYNVAGQIVYQKFNTSHTVINIKQGTYIIETIMDGSKSTQKVFVR